MAKIFSTCGFKQLYISVVIETVSSMNKSGPSVGLSKRTKAFVHNILICELASLSKLEDMSAMSRLQLQI